MTYKVRLAIFKLLEALPKKTGSFLYLTFQSLLGKASVEKNFASGKNGTDRFKSTIDKLGWNAIDAVIEVGSGWYPTTPLLLVDEFKGIDVYTYDINSFYTSKRIQESNEHFGIKSDKLVPQIQYFPNTDLTECGFPDLSNKVVVIYSKFVLEHIPNDIIKGIHQNVINKIGNHKVFHWISPSDHRFFSDKSLSVYDFLKFSEEDWKKNHTRFDYHNRTRLPEYLAIFLELGYEIELVDYNQPNDKVKDQFAKSIVAERFKKNTLEENLAGSIVLALNYSK